MSKKNGVTSLCLSQKVYDVEKFDTIVSHGNLGHTRERKYWLGIQKLGKSESP